MKVTMLAGAVALAPSIALAQGLGTPPRLELIEVTATRHEASLTAPSVAAARAALENVPGAIGFVEAETFLDSFALSIGDILAFTPGVFADTSSLRENRISIRGSGLSATFERRGLALYRDGVPITKPSGSTEFQEIDPLSIRYSEVFKGANGLRYGAASLGGAVNVVTRTAATAESPATASLEAGSFETVRAHGAFGVEGEGWDAYGSVTGLTTDGYRAHSSVDSIYLFGNLGYAPSDQLETRVWLTALSDNIDLPGSLSLNDALNDPQRAARAVTIGPFFPGGPVITLDPGPVADDWERDLSVLRLANKTVLALDAMTLEGGVYGGWRRLWHPITRFAGVVDQEEKEIGGFARATGQTARIDWVAGIEASFATTDAKQWENIGGNRGALRSASDQDSANLLVYGQGTLALTSQLSAVLGLQYALTNRDYTVQLGNDASTRRDFDQINPKLGLLYDVNAQVQLFANLSRSFEPPTFADLTGGGALGFNPLDAQTAWTAEIGSRGRLDWLAWDVAAYRSAVEDELVDFGVPGSNGFLTFTDNAEDTVRQGLEVGLDLYPWRQRLAADGLALVFRQVWSLNDFRFDGDPLFGDNQLAGVPEQLYSAELRLDAQSGWYAGLNLRWVPEGPFVDAANTTAAPGYDVWGATAGWQVADGWLVFASAENLFDTRYVSNVATNANQQIERGRVFTPGEGRALYAGLRVRFGG